MANLLQKLGFYNQQLQKKGQENIQTLPTQNEREIDSQWIAMEASVKAIHDLCIKNGATLLVILNGGTQYNAIHWKMFAKEKGFYILDIPEMFRKKSIDAKAMHFKIDGHWNSTGNRVVSEILAESLLNWKLIPSVLYQKD